MQLCRDVDWGTAPQWVTAVIALAALCVSTVGIVTATRSYKRSVKDTHEAQARRVHTVHREESVTSGQVALVREGFAEPGVISHRVDSSDKAFGFNTVAHAEIVHVTVHNNSDEIISNVAVRVRTDSVDWYPANAGYVIQALVPGAEYAISFVTLDRGNNGLSRQVLRFDIAITFTDSVGNHWTRTNAQPVEEVTENPFHAPWGPEMYTLQPGDPFSYSPRRPKPQPATSPRGQRLRRRTRRPDDPAKSRRPPG